MLNVRFSFHSVQRWVERIGTTEDDMKVAFALSEPISYAKFTREYQFGVLDQHRTGDRIFINLDEQVVFIVAEDSTCAGRYVVTTTFNLRRLSEAAIRNKRMIPKYNPRMRNKKKKKNS